MLPGRSDETFIAVEASLRVRVYAKQTAFAKDTTCFLPPSKPLQKHTHQVALTCRASDERSSFCLVCRRWLSRWTHTFCLQINIWKTTWRRHTLRLSFGVQSRRYSNKKLQTVDDNITSFHAHWQSLPKTTLATTFCRPVRQQRKCHSDAFALV